MLPAREEIINSSSNRGGSGDGEQPSPNDAAGDSPMNGREAASSADADDSSGDGVRGADWDAEVRGADERNGSSGFRGESAERRELGDALAHGSHNAPASGHGAATHGEMAGNDYPERHGISLEKAAGNERGGDDAHTFLRVIRAMAEAVGRRGKDLKAAKPAVHSGRRLFADGPTGDDGDENGDEHSDEGRQENEEDGHGPTGKNDGAEARAGYRGASVATHERVR